jgi:hypothetical protein
MATEPTIAGLLEFCGRCGLEVRCIEAWLCPKCDRPAFVAAYPRSPVVRRMAEADHRRRRDGERVYWVN